jgi:serine/threonine-protein kinase
MTLGKFEQYEIKAQLKQTDETVYRAFDAKFDRDVIINLWNWISFPNSKKLDEFMQKARVFMRLNHPCIVPVYDVGIINGNPYFVTKLMTGGSLADRLAQNRLNIKEVSKILSRIALGFDEVHKLGYVHSNLKPVKILFDDTNEAYVTDFFFGIFKDSQDEEGTVSGTPKYMSPEHARGEKLDLRSDIYSLGITLFEALSGKAPFHADSTFRMLMQHINEPPPNILDLNPSLPPIIRKFIEKAIAKQPRDRFASVGAMATTLEAIIDRFHNSQTYVSS